MAVNFSKLTSKLNERREIRVWPYGFWSSYEKARPGVFTNWLFEVHPDLPDDTIEAMIAESMEEEKPELLPCPFCRAKPIVDKSNSQFRVACLGCGAKNDWNQDRMVVVDAWNHRHA